MGIKTKPKVFETSDGEEWESEADAKERQVLLDAEARYESAVREYGQKLAESQRTKDGFPFEWGVMCNYWFPTLAAGFRPTLRQLSVIGRETTIVDGHVKVIPYQDGDGRKQSYFVSELFRREINAKRDLLKRLEKYRDQVNEDIDTLRKELSDK